jgi:hypothetical protein
VIKLLRRLFGASERSKADASANQATRSEETLRELREAVLNPETRPAVLQSLRKLEKQGPLGEGYRELLELLQAQEGMAKGLKAISDLALGKDALAESIIRDLLSDKDSAADLGGRNVNQDERMVLNFWGVTLCVMRAVPKVSDEEKRAFLDRYFEYLDFLCRNADPRLGWDVRRISALSEARYREYHTAFGEMMRRHEAVRQDPSVHLVPGAPLMHAITKNLFGLESDSLLLAFMIENTVMSHLISFAKTFGTAEGWATMRHMAEEACRVLRSGAMNS